jgi:large conductance mechanosensitive channel
VDRPDDVLKTLPRPAVLSEFKGFLLKSNALALAVGVIFATALGLVVGSLVNDIIMPPIGYLLGGVKFQDLQIVLGTTTAPDGTVTEVAIRWGAFVNTLLNFTIIAFIVWRITKLFLKEAPASEVKTCPFCKEANAVDATRCKACTSEI